MKGVEVERRRKKTRLLLSHTRKEREKKENNSCRSLARQGRMGKHFRWIKQGKKEGKKLLLHSAFFLSTEGE